MKTALCLFGLVGNIKGKAGKHSSDNELLELCYKHYKEHILDKNDIDVFIHTWDIQFKDRILELYKPKDSIFEKQIQFKTPDYIKSNKLRKNNHYSRWYSAWKSVCLKYRFERMFKFKYDMVMSSRFDQTWETDVVFEKFDPQYFYAGHWCELFDMVGRVFSAGQGPLYKWIKEGRDISDLKHSHYTKENKGLVDHWFFSNSKYMDKFHTLFLHLDEYLKDPEASKNGKISNHALAPYHLKKIGLWDKLKFVFHFFDDFPLARRKYFGVIE